MKAKKSLGQHFLKNERALEQIADAGNIQEGETVLEIGPGHGELTKKLLARGARTIAVEKDEGLAEQLEQIFSNAVATQQLTVIPGDIIDGSLEVQLPNEYKVIANIPYYITGAIIRTFLTHKNQPSRLVLLIQKEVAERVVAKEKKESLLSLSVKAYGEPRIAGTVKKGAFSPPPKVDSAILVIEDISREQFAEVDEDRFFELLHTAFAEKRKQLFPKLKRKYSIDEAVFDDCGLEKTIRAEDVSLEQFFCLTRSTSN